MSAMQQNSSLGRLLRRVHEDQRGAVSIETIMIIGAIAIPILIFLLKFGWPRIKEYFNNGMNDLEANRTRVMNQG
jgi:Flp pilus assembly pilin Flp